MPSDSDHSVAVEDYIKQIWKLQRRADRASTKALAERLALGRGTVSGMLRHLAERGLIHHEPYHGVRLTDAGEKLALRIVRRHRLLELFLVKTLDLGWEQVHDDAERIEHAVSDELIEHIDAFLGHPETDPHGAPIPSAAGRLERQNYSTLGDSPIGQRVRVRRVSDSDPQFLKHLDEVGIELNAELTVVGVDPFGTMRVQIDDREAHLAREATLRIEVSSA